MLLCEKKVMLLPLCLGLHEVGDSLEGTEDQAQNIVHSLNPLQATTKGRY